MIPLFQNNNILDIDIIAFQKPWKNTRDQTIYHPQKDSFHLFNPKAIKQEYASLLTKRLINLLGLTPWTDQISLAYTSICQIDAYTSTISTIR